MNPAGNAKQDFSLLASFSKPVMARSISDLILLNKDLLLSHGQPVPVLIVNQDNTLRPALSVLILVFVIRRLPDYPALFIIVLLDQVSVRPCEDILQKTGAGRLSKDQFISSLPDTCFRTGDQIEIDTPDVVAHCSRDIAVPGKIRDRILAGHAVPVAGKFEQLDAHRIHTGDPENTIRPVYLHGADAVK